MTADDTRVILDLPPGESNSDYINASFIRREDDRKPAIPYISAQGFQVFYLVFIDLEVPRRLPSPIFGR